MSSTGEGAWLSADAPAKVNLGLAVTGTRPDGYHQLRSIFLRVGLADELYARIDADAHDDDLAVVGDPDCPVQGNLALRAVGRVRGTLAPDAPSLRIRLTKRIPMGAGLGGGSSDAAAALRLCVDAWSIDPETDELRAVALQLGADVPFFLGRSPAAIVSGIGERSDALGDVPAGVGLLLFVPAVAISTAEAFRIFDAGARPERRSTEAIESMADELRGGMDAATFAESSRGLRDANDLWPAAAALAPSLPELRERLERALDRPFLLSGSGSTLLALYPSTVKAGDAVARLRTDEPKIVAEARLVTAVPLDA